MINEKSLLILKKRYKKRCRQMDSAYLKVVQEAPRWMLEDVAPNLRRELNREHLKLRWIEERLKTYGTSSN